MFSSLVWEICSSGLYRWRSADRLDHFVLGGDGRDVADMVRLLIIDDSRMVQAKRLRSFSHRPSQKA
jgi:hypothetical protein